jgi:hypothetical protein
MKISEDKTTIIFIDTFYGLIEFNYYEVVGGRWVPTEIPDFIISDFNKFFEMCKKWDEGYYD